MPWLIALGVLAALVAATSGAKASPAATKYVDRLKRAGGGKALVSFTLRKVFWRINPKTNKEEFRTEVVENPADIAVAVGNRIGKPGDVGLNVLALATLIASEAGGGHPLAKTAIAWAAVNAAKKDRVSVFRKIAPNGKFGSQQGGRYAASKAPPTLQDLEIARAVLEGKLADPTKSPATPGGAIQWDSPRAQRALLARGEAGYSKTPEQVEALRRADGRKMVTLPGVDPNYLRLWA